MYCGDVLLLRETVATRAEANMAEASRPG